MRINDTFSFYLNDLGNFRRKDRVEYLDHPEEAGAEHEDGGREQRCAYVDVADPGTLRPEVGEEVGAGDGAGAALHQHGAHVLVLRQVPGPPLQDLGVDPDDGVCQGTGDHLDVEKKTVMGF